MDCFFMRDADGYLVVAYGPRLVGFYLIDIDVVEALRAEGKVSITEADAAQVGKYVEIPKKP